MWDGLVGGVVFEQKITKGTKGCGEGWAFVVGDFFSHKRHRGHKKELGRRGLLSCVWGGNFRQPAIANRPGWDEGIIYL